MDYLGLLEGVLYNIKSNEKKPVDSSAFTKRQMELILRTFLDLDNLARQRVVAYNRVLHATKSFLRRRYSDLNKNFIAQQLTPLAEDLYKEKDLKSFWEKLSGRDYTITVPDSHYPE